jgi:hypothetical protein
MSKWFTANGLSLNFDKTKVMKFDLNYVQNGSFQFFNKDKVIKEVINTKLLGLETDKNMYWKNHTVHILTKLSTACCAIRYMYKGVSKSSRTVLVKRSLLTLDVKFLHHLQSTPLLHEYSGPSVSAMLGSIPGSSFLELCQVPAAIPLESLRWC